MMLALVLVLAAKAACPEGATVAEDLPFCLVAPGTKISHRDDRAIVYLGYPDHDSLSVSWAETKESLSSAIAELRVTIRERAGEILSDEPIAGGKGRFLTYRIPIGQQHGAKPEDSMSYYARSIVVSKGRKVECSVNYVFHDDPKARPDPKRFAVCASLAPKQ